MKIGICGYPSRLGGADTELDHQMRVWVELGFELHLVHTGDIDDNLKAMKMEERPGVVIHEPRDWSKLKGMPAISYCNGAYLKALPEIREYASQIWWVNCMSWNFPDEITAHKNGYIDHFIYQTDQNRKKLSAELRSARPANRFIKVSPYFDSSRFKYTPDPPDDKFRFCKISRADADKYNHQTWWLYDNFTAPVMKEGHILGWNEERMAPKCGNPPEWINAEPEGTRKVEELYEKCHALIAYADERQTENLPRVGFEAMATGTVLVVDRRGGWIEEIEDGVTGWLCSTEREFAYKASRCAFEKKERLEMAEAARDNLDSQWGMEAAKKNWGNFFNTAL